MLLSLRAVLPVLFAVAMLESSISLLNPYVSYLLEQQKVSPVLIGALTSCHYFGFVIGAFNGPYFIRRLGHIRAAILYAVFGAITVLMHILFHQVYSWLILRFFIGMSIAGMFLVIESWLNAQTKSQWRGQILAIYSTISWFFSGIGPLALRIEDNSGIIIFIIIAVIMISSMTPLALTRINPPDVTTIKSLGYKKIGQTATTAIMACFTAGFIYTPLYSLLPSVTENLAFSKEQLSLLLVLGPLTVIITLPPIGWLSDRIGRLQVLAFLATLSSIVAFVIFMHRTASCATTLLLFILLTCFISPFYSIGLSRAADIIPKNNLVEANALLLIVWGLGAALGPTAAGFVMHILDAQALFLFCSLVTLLLSISITWIILRKPFILDYRQKDFIAMPLSSTPNIDEVDPHSHR